jgi:hypothetical protein
MANTFGVKIKKEAEEVLLSDTGEIAYTKF